MQSNGWSTVVIILLLFGAGFFVGRFSHTPQVIQTEHLVLKPGIPDTVFVDVPATVGHSEPEHSTTVYTGELEPITIVAMPDYAETEVIIDEPGVEGRIRATAYPYVLNDTLLIDLPIEWNLQAKPIHITQVDTLTVTVEKPTPWIEEPEVVATGVSLFWLAVIIFL